MHATVHYPKAMVIKFQLYQVLYTAGVLNAVSITFTGVAFLSSRLANDWSDWLTVISLSSTLLPLTYLCIGFCATM